MKSRRASLPLLAALAVCAAGPSAAQSPPAPQNAPRSGPEAAAPPPLPEFASPSPAVARRVGGLIDRIRQSQLPAEREELLAAVLDVGPAAIPVVLAELDRRTPASWGAMAYLLGAFGDPRTIPYLRRELPREAGAVYLDLLYALTLAGDPEAPLLALRSTHATVSFGPDATAIDFIAGALGPKFVPQLLHEIPRRGQVARIAGLGALGTIGDAAAVPFLLEWSKRPNAVDRRYALMALARIGDPRGGPRLVEALADPDGTVQDAAVEAAGYLRRRDAVPRLTQFLKPDQTSGIEQRAIWSLGLIGGPEAAKALSAALAGSKEPEAALILRALGKTQEPAAAAAIAPLALGSDAPLAATAVRALTELPDEAARDRLLAVCADAPVHEAGLEAAHALVLRGDPRAMPCALGRVREEIARRNGLDPIAEELVLRLPLAAPASFAQSLETTSETISAPALQHRLLEAARLTRMVQERGGSVEPLLEVLETGTPNEVDVAIQRLGDLHDPAAIEPLVSLFGRIEPDRAWRIPEALGRIGSERATSFLVQLLTDDVYRVPSLARAREEAARALARFSRSPSAADALRQAYVAERGRLFVPLMAYARVRGAEAIPDLLELKTLLLRSRAPEQVLRHEKVNWAMRMLRSGQEIPLDELRDVK